LAGFRGDPTGIDAWILNLDKFFNIISKS
jgi:hypothetical protein